LKKTLFPWSKLKKGQGFFIPCLDTDAVRQAGLTAALHAKVLNAKAFVGVKQRRLGVLFLRA
jgi:hypothetical protein